MWTLFIIHSFYCVLLVHKLCFGLRATLEHALKMQVNDNATAPFRPYLIKTTASTGQSLQPTTSASHGQ